METKEKVICLAILLLMTAVARGSHISPGNETADGGNITHVNISVVSHTEVWQGLVGRVALIAPDSPTSIVADGGDINLTNITLTLPCTTPVSVGGFIIFSNSSMPPTGLVAGNLTLLDIFTGTPSHNGTYTFTSNSTFTINSLTISDVPTVFTFRSSSSQSAFFREGYFNDNASNLVFAVEIDFNISGYNNTVFDYQAILPTLNTTETTYFLTNGLQVTCAPGPGGGAGGGGRGGAGRICPREMNCSAWGPCAGGLQNRICETARGCPPLNVTPSLVRVCPSDFFSRKEFPTRITEDEIIQKIFEKVPPLLAIPDFVRTFSGEVLRLDRLIQNPDVESLERVLLRLNAPAHYYKFVPLHARPLFFGYFGLVPLRPVQKELKWKQLGEKRFRLLPREEKMVTIDVLTPLLPPQTVEGKIEVLSGAVSVLSKPITIKVETRPITIHEEKEGKITELQMLIDNREKPARKERIEVDFNKGRRTLFTEVYVLDVPADSVAQYGHVYHASFDYYEVRARNRNGKIEVR